MKKDDAIKQLIEIAFKIDKKISIEDMNTKQLRELAQCARTKGKKSQEFIEMMAKIKPFVVVNLEDDLRKLQKIVAILRKFNL